MGNTGNTRIAKNTVYMYLRMLLIMVVSLFTSRVVLQTLGESDFGTYNIVGGVVILFTFINSAMTTGTQRHLSYELGKSGGDVKTIFSACLRIHIYLALIILVLAETVGLWFLNAKMNFPEGRMAVVNWIYQFSIISCVLGVIRAPYNAAIIAYERMSFYAYSSIVEVIAKLVIVYLLVIIPFDKLIVYALLVLGVTILMQVWYMIYCKKLPGIKYVNIKDKSLYRYLLSFSGWALFGSLANMGYQQGVNIIINLFYGVTLNAAVGIANQVNSAVNQFATGFQQAINPQLVQSEAAHDRERQKSLLIKSSKLSYFIMFIIAFPLIANIDCVLSLWLGEYPEHTGAICSLTLIGVLITCLSGPLWVTIYATGRIKTYQIIISCIALSVLPINYIGGRYGMSPEVMFAVRASNYIFILIAQLLFMRKFVELSICNFVRKVLFPVVIVTVLSGIFHVVLSRYISYADSLMSLLYQTVIYVAISGLLIWFVGLTKSERVWLINISFTKFHLKRYAQ